MECYGGKSGCRNEPDDRPTNTVVKTFLMAKDDTTLIANPEAPENIENLRKITRNILKDFSMIAKENDESKCLPAPSAKETVRVFLRVKPKTLEESKYCPPVEKKTASSLDTTEVLSQVLTFNTIM